MVTTSVLFYRRIKLLSEGEKIFPLVTASGAVIWTCVCKLGWFQCWKVCCSTSKNKVPRKRKPTLVNFGFNCSSCLRAGFGIRRDKTSDPIAREGESSFTFLNNI